MLPESPKILAPMILLYIFKLLVERKKKKAGFSNITGLESEDQGDPAK